MPSAEHAVLIRKIGRAILITIGLMTIAAATYYALNGGRLYLTNNTPELVTVQCGSTKFEVHLARTLWVNEASIDLSLKIASDLFLKSKNGFFTAMEVNRIKSSF